MIVLPPEEAEIHIEEWDVEQVQKHEIAVLALAVAVAPAPLVVPAEVQLV